MIALYSDEEYRKLQCRTKYYIKQQSCTVLHCIELSWDVLYCTILFCTVLYFTVLYCIVLSWVVLYCTILYYTVLHCTVLCCTVLYCTRLSRDRVYHTMQPYSSPLFLLSSSSPFFHDLLLYGLLFSSFLFFYFDVLSHPTFAVHSHCLLLLLSLLLSFFFSLFLTNFHPISLFTACWCSDFS